MNIHRSLVLLMLFSIPAAGAERRPVDESEELAPRVRSLKADRHSRMQANAIAPKPIIVDCAKGESIQKQVDLNDSPMTIEVSGICVENVLIDRKDVTLRGTNPMTDGIQGASPAALSALEIRYSGASRLENISVSGSPGVGFAAFFSNLTMTNCRFVGNGGSGIHVSEGSFVDAAELTMSQNLRGVTAHRGGAFFCEGCRLENNTRFAAVASQGGLLALLDSVVTGQRGIAAVGGGSYADIDCISVTSSFPCSLNVTGQAALASDGGNATLFGAGAFTGSVRAALGGIVNLYGARQMATGQPGQGPGQNVADWFGRITVDPSYENGFENSRLMGAILRKFSRLIVVDKAALAGPVQCQSASDAWFDPTLTVEPGAAVSNCEHGSLPAAP